MKIKKVAFEPMNEIHENEVKILNKLLTSIEKNENIEEFFEIFFEDVKKHFEFEEKLMKKYNFFAYIPHKIEHDKIINKLSELKNKLNDSNYLKDYFYNQFIPWLDNHINTIDTVTAGFLDTINAKI